ncbi:MAG: hypothetical protein LBL30_03945 [Holosporales bacterium]|jgi:ATP-dependent helicase/nuclease subunit B|nr:hypothetical protein [Holosporales bacterium]
MSSNVINFGFSEPFIPAFSKWMLDKVKDEPILLLTPTRRSAKKLRRGVIEQLGATDDSNLIKAYSVFDLGPEGEPIPTEQTDQIPLFKAVREYFGRDKSLSQCLAITYNAQEILTLLNLEEINLKAIKDIVPLDLSAYAQKILSFLSHIAGFWVEDKTKHSLDMLSQKWASNPPQYPVFAIGLNGAFPSVNRLVKTISELPFGCVVLLGADPEALGHTLKRYSLQRSFQRLLTSIGVEPGSISTICKISPTEKHISAVLPSADYKIQADIPSITIIECENPQEEAAVNALIIREISPTPLLITAEASSALRIREIVKLFGFGFYNSQSDPLSKTAEFTVLRQIAEVISSSFSTHPTLEALKNTFNFDKDIFKELATFELALRGETQAHRYFISAVNEHAQFIEEKMPCSSHKIFNVMSFLKSLPSVDRPHAIRDWIKIHKDFVDVLNQESSGHIANDILRPESDVAGIWSKLENLLSPLLNEIVPADEYVNVFCLLFWKIKPTSQGDGDGKHLYSLGVLESRLLDAPNLIIPDVNEGTWPPIKNIAGNLLSQSILSKVGLQSFDRKVELFGLEFSKALCGKNVFLTRSKTKDGSPTQPSRWLVRLMASLKGNAELARQRGEHWLSRARDQNRSNPQSKVLPPCPLAPASTQIKELSLSDLNTLFKNPYEVYAKHVLKLTPCPNFWDEPNKTLNLRRKISGRSLLAEADKTLQQLKDKRIVQDLDMMFSSDQGSREIAGSITFDLLDGSSLEVKTKFDLVKFGSSDDQASIEIVNYKGSAQQNISDIKAGLDLKTNLQIIIASSISLAQKPSKINVRFLHMHGGIKSIKETTVFGDKILENKQAIISKIQEEIYHLFSSGMFPAKPCGVSHYSRLAREKEWSAPS